MEFMMNTCSLQIENLNELFDGHINSMGAGLLSKGGGWSDVEEANYIYIYIYIYILIH